MIAKNSILSGFGLFLGVQWSPKPWLVWLSPLYWAITKLHRVYMQMDFGLYGLKPARHPAHPTIPFIVVGALKAGGSGKTSVTMALAQAFSSQGLKVAVLAYRIAPNLGLQEQDTLFEVRAESDWRKSSEEAVMLSRLSGARVFVTRHRVRAWRRLHSPDIHAGRPFDLILSDDGYQDPRLRGALRLLLMEPGIRPGISALLPAGPYRETFRSYARAHFVLEGPHSEIADGSDRNHMEGGDEPTPAKPVYRFWRSLCLPNGIDLTRPWIALCALGDNAPFLADLARQGITPVAVLAGPNHTAIAESRIAAIAKQHPGAGFLCTPKDFIKLDRETTVRFSIYSVTQEIRLDARIPQAIEAYRLQYSG